MNFSKHWAAQLDDYVIDLAWSPDGSLLAAASAAGPVTIYDATTGAVKHALAGHSDGANCLAWLPAPTDNPPADLSVQPSAFSLRLFTGGQDGCVRIWDATSGAQIAETNLGHAWVEHLAVVPAAASPADSRVPSSGTPPASSGVQPSALSTQPLLFAAAGRKLVALRPDGSLAHTFPDFPKTISALAALPAANSSQPSAAPISPHNPHPITFNHAAAAIAAASFGLVRTFDATTFAPQKEYTYGNAIYALTWSPDRRWLVAGCHDNAVHLWAPAEDLELHMSGYETRLKELSFSHDSRWLATGGGRDACVWDCSGSGPEGREPLPLPHEARVCAVAYQNAHSLVATGDTRGVFTLWSPSRKNPMVAEVTMPAAATKFAWRHDDRLLAVGTEKGHLFTFRTA